MCCFVQFFSYPMMHLCLPWNCYPIWQQSIHQSRMWIIIMLLTNNINTSVVVGWFFTLMKNLWYPFIYIYIYIYIERERERENCLSSGYSSKNLKASFGFANQTWFWFAWVSTKGIHLVHRCIDGGGHLILPTSAGH